MAKKYINKLSIPELAEKIRKEIDPNYVITTTDGIFMYDNNTPVIAVKDDWEVLCLENSYWWLECPEWMNLSKRKLRKLRKIVNFWDKDFSYLYKKAEW